MEVDGVPSAALLQLFFMLGCILACIIVYWVPWFDLRSLKRKVQAQIDSSADKTDDRSISTELLDRPDLGAILNLLVIIGTGIAILIGWRVPAEIERIYGGGASFGILFPSVEMTTMGRAAQVIGALCLGLIALRLLRLLVFFCAAGLGVATAMAAVDYVFDLSIFGLF